MHDSPAPQPQADADPGERSIPEYRIKLAFVSMLVAGVLMPFFSYLLSGGGQIVSVVIPSLVFFPLICILWPSWQTPLFAVLIVYWVEFIVGGIIGGASVFGLVLTHPEPSLLTIPLGAMAAGWLAAVATRAFLTLRKKTTGQ